jgi:hypothetical protein
MGSQLVLGQTYEYVPFPEENAFWYHDVFSSVSCGPWPGICEQGEITQNGDTVVDGKLYVRLSPVYNGVVANSWHCWFREDTIQRRVYAIWPDGDPTLTEHLVYDFSLVPGDTSYVPSPIEVGTEYYIVNQIDSLEIDGVYRKRFTFTAPFGGSTDLFWIEGIGSGNGPFLPYSEFEYWTTLRCFVNGILLYSNPISIPPENLLSQYPWYQYCDPTIVGLNEIANSNQPVVVYPNPVVDYLKIRFLDFNKINALYLTDILGCRTFLAATETEHNLSALPNGVYQLTAEFKNRPIVNLKIIKQ